MSTSVVCYRSRGFELDDDSFPSRAKSRPSSVHYKYCKVEDLSQEQKEWLRKYNGIVLGDFFAGGGGEIPSHVLDFLNESPVWFASFPTKNVPSGCVITHMFYLDVIDS